MPQLSTPEEINKKKPLYCPDPQAAQEMLARLEELRAEEGLAGRYSKRACRLGEPVFDKLDARLQEQRDHVGRRGRRVEIGVCGAAGMLGSGDDPITPEGYESE